MKWIYLIVAIIAEVVATSALKYSEGFTKLIPSTIVVGGYGVAFYFLALTLKDIPIGIAYAIWSGVGTVLIAVLAYFVFKQKLDLASVIGIGLIVSGVIVINVFSKSATH